MRESDKPVEMALDGEVDAGGGSSDHAFGGVFTVVFGIIGLWPLLDGGAPLWWSLGLSLAFAVCATTCPRLLKPLNRVWTRFGMLLHRITSPVMLGLVFFAVLTPTGLIMRLVKKDPLDIEIGVARSSFWHSVSERTKSAASLRNQF